VSKAWRIVGTVVLVLAVAGVVAGGIGLLTGASLDRMVENIFGGYEALNMILDVLTQEVGKYLPGFFDVVVIGG